MVYFYLLHLVVKKIEKTIGTSRLFIEVHSFADVASSPSFSSK